MLSNRYKFATVHTIPTVLLIYITLNPALVTPNFALEIFFGNYKHYCYVPIQWQYCIHMLQKFQILGLVQGKPDVADLGHHLLRDRSCYCHFIYLTKRLTYKDF